MVQEGTISLETGPSFPSTGLADGDPGIRPAGRGAHAAGEQGGTLNLLPPAWPNRASHGWAVTKFLCLGQVDSTQERVVKREDGEKLAKVSQNGAGDEVSLRPYHLGCLHVVSTQLPAALCRSTGYLSWKPAPRPASTWTWLSQP